MQARQSSSTTLELVAALNILLGILLLASSYVLQYSLYDTARITGSLFGPLVLGVAITRLAFGPRFRWIAIVNVLFGVWVAITPFVLGYTGTLTGTVTNVVLGVLIALVAATSFLGG